MPHPLSSFSFAVMAVVGRDGASGPELVQMASGGAPFFWTGAGSHVLRTARRLIEAHRAWIDEVETAYEQARPD